MNATSDATLQTSLRNLSNRIFPLETFSKLNDDQMCIRVSNWLSEQENTKWLLIFDNYDDPDEYSIEKYYPFVARGSVIVTTRLPDRLNGQQVRVRSMTKEDDSLRILATRSGWSIDKSGKIPIHHYARAF